MIRAPMLIVGLCVLVAACAEPARTDSTTKIRYIRQDGQQVFRIDLANDSIRFTDANNEGGDLGGLVRNCGNDTVECLNLAGYLVAVPKAQPSSDTWFAGGAEFSVVGRADRAASPVWLVKVTVQGDPYMYFSYSAQRGVESISLQSEGVGPDLAKTYLLAGERGLLAKELVVGNQGHNT